MTLVAGQQQPGRQTQPIQINLRADQLVTTLDLIADGLAVVDADGTMIFVNRPLCELFGYGPEDLLGQSVEVLVPDELRRTHRRGRAGFAEQQQSRAMGRPDLDIEGRHADGRRIPIDVKLAPLGRTGLVAATIRDVSEMRRAAADRALSRLDLHAAHARVANLVAAHDLALQQLFALGAHFQAQATRASPGMRDLFAAAVTTVDEVITSIRLAVHGPDDVVRPDAAHRQGSAPRRRE
jgi:PAS domain S-box-containing protein